MSSVSEMLDMHSLDLFLFYHSAGHDPDFPGEEMGSERLNNLCRIAQNGGKWQSRDNHSGLLDPQAPFPVHLAYGMI